MHKQFSESLTNVKHKIFEVGDVVRFAAPLSDDEAVETFKVLELRESRVLVEAICDMSLKPTFVYSSSDLVKV